MCILTCGSKLAFTTSLGCTICVLILIDDYSIKIWVFSLMNEDKKISKFKQWKIFVESITNKIVKRLKD